MLNNESEKLVSEDLKKFMENKEKKPSILQQENILFKVKARRNRWFEKMKQVGLKVVENHTFEDGVTCDYYLPENNKVVCMMNRDAFISSLKQPNTYGLLKCKVLEQSEKKPKVFKFYTDRNNHWKSEETVKMFKNWKKETEKKETQKNDQEETAEVPVEEQASETKQ